MQLPIGVIITLSVTSVVSEAVRSVTMSDSGKSGETEQDMSSHIIASTIKPNGIHVSEGGTQSATTGGHVSGVSGGWV